MVAAGNRKKNSWPLKNFLDFAKDFKIFTDREKTSWHLKGLIF